MMGDRQSRQRRRAEILLVEDDAAGVRLTMEAMRESAVDNRVEVVTDGDDALRYLRCEAPFEDATRPDLVLLDLNLPRLGGFEVLSAAKGDPRLRSIPMLVLTTSAAEEDVRRSYDLGANGYIVKPADLDGLVDVLQSIERFWLNTVQLPPFTEVG